MSLFPSPVRCAFFLPLGRVLYFSLRVSFIVVFYFNLPLLSVLIMESLGLFLVPVFFSMREMELDFIERLQNITLTKEEEEVIQVGATQRDRILEECSLMVCLD